MAAEGEEEAQTQTQTQTQEGFIPDPWRQPNMQLMSSAPSMATKAAARRLVMAAEFQEALGWLLITHFGLLLGSFGQNMSQREAWISWAIVVSEAIAKFCRTYLYNRCFRDVPCAFIPLHRQYRHYAFGIYAQFAAFLVQSFLSAFLLWAISPAMDKLSGSSPPSMSAIASAASSSFASPILYQLFVAGVAIALLHLAAGAMLLAFMWTARRFRGDDQILAFVTWWVHLWRHAHLSAAAASAQPDVCGLPAYWFLPAPKLWEHLLASMPSAAVDKLDHHCLPAASIQAMALRGILSLCIQSMQPDTVVRATDHDSIVEIIGEGRNWECKGLAAAIAGSRLISGHVSGTIPSTADADSVRLAEGAVRPLKAIVLRLSTSSEEHADDQAECLERSVGSLLNAALVIGRRRQRIESLFGADELSGETASSLMECLMKLARGRRPAVSRRCQTLAVSLLAVMAGDNPKIVIRHLLDESHRSSDQQQLNRRTLPILLDPKRIRDLDLRAAAAGFYWQLAYHAAAGGQKEQILPRSTVALLVHNLKPAPEQEFKMACACAGALASYAYNDKDAKSVLLHGGSDLDTIGNALELLCGAKDAVLGSCSNKQMFIAAAAAAAETCRLLWILADNNPDVQRNIANRPGLIDGIRDLLKFETKNLSPKTTSSAEAGFEMRMKAQAAWLVSRLACRNKENQAAMGNADVISILVKLLRGLEEERARTGRSGDGGMGNAGYVIVARRVMQSLGDLADGCDRNCERVAGSEGALRDVASCLQNTEDEKLAFFVARCVRVLLESPSSRAPAVAAIESTDLRLSELSRRWSFGDDANRRGRQRLQDELHTIQEICKAPTSRTAPLPEP